MSRTRIRRMTPLAAMLLRFVTIFVAVLMLLALAWPTVAPMITRIATPIVRVGFQLAESPRVSVLETRGDELWVHRIVGPGQITPFTWFDRYTFFALIPLIALFAATPGLGWIKRVSWLSVSVVLLFLIQTSYVVVSVQLAYAAIGLTTVGALAARTLGSWQVLTRVLWEAAPLVLWVAFTATTWARLLRKVREAGSPSTVRSNGIKILRIEAGKGWES